MNSSYKKLQLIVELSGTGTWEWNVQTGETIFNESWANMLGYSLEELMPTTIETWTKLTHPDDLKSAQNALEKYFNKETDFYEAKFRMRHKNGKWVWLLDRGQVAEWTPDDKPLLMLGTHQNINAIKETEISLQYEEERLESLLKINQHQANSVQELLDFVLDEAIALTNSKIGYIYFYNEEKKEFTLNTWSKEVMQQCHVIDPQTIYKLEKTGIWGEAVRQRKPILVNDFKAPNPLKKGIPEGHAPLQKFLTIPVFDQNKIVAVVGVANKPDDYDNSDIRQLTLMMDSVWKIVQRKESDQKLKRPTACMPLSVR
ncbi:MAG: GAF domain-containing protein [Prolixibacteraceae bacterium]|nr:GAF domain-containing protein [Prolixibacteraceae bacterium]